VRRIQPVSKDNPVFDDNTKKIGALAGIALATGAAITMPSEHRVCDLYVWCAPPPTDQGDEPARDGPGPLRARLVISATASVSASTGALAMLGGRPFASFKT
jgi:hypothetical protein